MKKLRVPFFRPSISPEASTAIADVLHSGHLTSGEKCLSFEKQFAQAIGAKHAVTVNSGSAALHLALAVKGVGNKDVVFVPTIGFAADAQAVEWRGAVPVFVDSDPQSLCIDPESVLSAIKMLKSVPWCNSLTCKAVIAVDYAGQMADYTGLRDLCEKYGLVLIEDAAHALPAAWRSGQGSGWRSAGTVADLGCFSFYANKTLTTGEGGMVVTNDELLSDHIRRLRLHGFDSDGSQGFQASWNRQIVELGFKYNLSDLAASMGICQLDHIHEYHDARRAVAQKYAALLGDISQLQLPEELPNRKHSWHLYVVRIRGIEQSSQRDLLIQRLKERGVETSVHWRPLHLHRYYQQKDYIHQELPVAETVCPTLLSLPIYPSMNDDEIEMVAHTLKRELNQ